MLAYYSVYLVLARVEIVKQGLQFVQKWAPVWPQRTFSAVLGALPKQLPRLSATPFSRALRCVSRVGETGWRHGRGIPQRARSLQ